MQYNVLFFSMSYCTGLFYRCSRSLSPTSHVPVTLTHCPLPFSLGSPFLPFFLPSTEPIPCYLLLNSVSVCAASRLVTTDSRHRDGRETPPGRGSARATHAWCLPTTVRPGLTSGYKRFLLPRLGDPRERTEEIVWLVRAGRVSGGDESQAPKFSMVFY